MGLLADDRPARVPVDDNQISVTHITEIISSEVLPRSRRQNWGSGGSFAWGGGHPVTGGAGVPCSSS